jgi:hypothetical protein
MPCKLGRLGGDGGCSEPRSRAYRGLACRGDRSRSAGEKNEAGTSRPPLARPPLPFNPLKSLTFLPLILDGLSPWVPPRDLGPIPPPMGKGPGGVVGIFQGEKRALGALPVIGSAGATDHGAPIAARGGCPLVGAVMGMGATEREGQTSCGYSTEDGSASGRFAC